MHAQIQQPLELIQALVPMLASEPLQRECYVREV
jgi:hypothetical protein